MAQVDAQPAAGPGARRRRCAAAWRSQTLQRLIAQAALSQELQRLRIVTPDAAVRQAVFAHAGVPRPQRPVRPADLRDRAAQQRPDRAALPRHDARATWRSGSCWTRSAPAPRRRRCCCARCSRASSRSGPPTWWNSRSPPRRSRRRRPRPSCSAGTTIIPDLYSSPGIPQDQGGRAVAADAGEGDPDHRCRSAGRLRAAQGGLRDAGEALGRGDLGAGRGEGQGAGRHWQGGADWAAMQKAAQDAGGSAITLDDATERQFPDPDLAQDGVRRRAGYGDRPGQGRAGLAYRAGHQGHAGQRRSASTR